MIRIFAVLLAVLTLLTASPAHAGPLAPLVPIVIGAVVKSAVVKLALTLAATVAMSMLTKGSKKSRAPGIMIEQTLQGGTNPRTIILGLYATNGSEVTPPMSYGVVNKTPNSRLFKIIAFADVPVDGLSRVIINGEYCALTSAGGSKYNIGGKYAGKAWVTFYDGRQTTADGATVGIFAAYPNRPWTSTRVGKGVSYGIFEFLYDAEVYKSEPTIRVELRGMRLYDVRKDSTAGGSGLHRWDDKSTWEYTVNNGVMIYNILRGIELDGGVVYGGDATADELPFANWAAAMNVCDEDVEIGGGGTEKRYRAGYEFSLDQEPADVIEELLKGCSGQIFENAGTYKVRFGPPALPVMYVTDESFVVTKEQELDPFPPINSSRNTVHAVFPHPDEVWGQHDAPQLQIAEYLARDNGQELTVDLSFPAVPYPRQVQRLMRSWLEDDQRLRRHTGTLDHRAFALEPLDTIAWTSERNGYIEKLFELSLGSKSLYNAQTAPALREVDPSDYHWNSSDELPDPISGGGWVLPEPQAVEGFTVLPWSIKDADDDERRPAIRVTWDVEGAVDAMAIRIEVRVAATGEAVAAVTVANVGTGEQIISEGIMPATSYEVRGRYLVERATEWTSWFGVTTPDVRLGSKDLSFDEILESLGPSMLLPSLTKPGKSAIIQQIIDAAYNDSAVRTANDLQQAAFEGVNGNTASIRQETLTRLTEDEAIVQQLTVQIARIDNNAAAIVTEQTTRANADTALSASISLISATVDGNTAAITAESIARADADSALAVDISGLGVEVDGNTAAITAESIARADADTALSGLITTVTARLDDAGGPGVSVEEAFIAQGNSIDDLYGEYTIKINVDGRISGFGLASTGTSSEFAILADRFVVIDPSNNSVTGYPFQVVGGNVYIRKAFIQTITSDQITTGSFITLSAQIANGIITTAKIGDLQVDTIKIANNALTVPFHTVGSSVGFTPGSGEVTLVETSVLNIGSVGATASCSVGFYATARTSGLAGFGGDAACDLKMYVDHQDGAGYVLMGAQSVGLDVASGTGYFWIPVSMIDMETSVINAKFKVTGTCVTGPNGAAATGINIGAPTLIVQGAKK